MHYLTIHTHQVSQARFAIHESFLLEKSLNASCCLVCTVRIPNHNSHSIWKLCMKFYLIIYERVWHIFWHDLLIMWHTYSDLLMLWNVALNYVFCKFPFCSCNIFTFCSQIFSLPDFSFSIWHSWIHVFMLYYNYWFTFIFCWFSSLICFTV